MLAISGNNTGCLLFRCNYAIAIIKYLNTSKGTLYFIFDSNSRNSSRITESPLSFSVLLQFANIVQLERYIEDAYNIANQTYRPYFQIHFLLVNINESDLRAIRFCHINLFRSTKRRKKKEKSSLKKMQKKMKQTEATEAWIE